MQPPSATFNTLPNLMPRTAKSISLIANRDRSAASQESEQCPSANLHRHPPRPVAGTHHTGAHRAGRVVYLARVDCGNVVSVTRDGVVAEIDMGYVALTAGAPGITAVAAVAAVTTVATVAAAAAIIAVTAVAAVAAAATVTTVTTVAAATVAAAAAVNAALRGRKDERGRKEEGKDDDGLEK
ncbi:hypothetical protein CERSUDRAFT_96130 [Gelatoporia subvermispora B]|uniref:Uncharacterized protein n=1 Tax=Ceriporiopsis subvermispora (strain B) TaxID=914234 RepID=M2QV07_CERS8|nr:hypothetical protein CERSUDRAFT_96130 [Gelatoporia subvermispora B]